GIGGNPGDFGGSARFMPMPIIFWAFLNSRARTHKITIGDTDLINVRFSNRPSGVKHFQAIRHASVDVAHGLALLFGLGPSFISHLVLKAPRPAAGPATEVPILTTPTTLSGGTFSALPTLLSFSFLPSRLLAST